MRLSVSSASRVCFDELDVRVRYVGQALACGEARGRDRFVLSGPERHIPNCLAQAVADGLESLVWDCCHKCLGLLVWFLQAIQRLQALALRVIGDGRVSGAVRRPVRFCRVDWYGTPL